MHRMRNKGMLAMLALVGLALAATTASAGPDATREYVVVYEHGADAAAARAAVERAGRGRRREPCRGRRHRAVPR